MTSAILLMVATQVSVGVKIDGEGYLRFARDGRPVYSKTAELVVKDGHVASTLGPYLVPETRVEGDPDALRVTLDGTLYAHYQKGEVKIGRIVLVQFGADVRPIVSEGFLICSGKGTVGDPGSGLLGVVRTVMPDVKAVQPPSGPEPESGQEEVKVYGLESIASEPAKPDHSTAEPGSQSFLKAGGVKVTLNTDAMVDGDTVLLGDVATISANAAFAPKFAAVEVGSTPTIGITANFARSAIERALERAGVSRENIEILGAGYVKVVRAYQQIDQSRFIQAAVELSKPQLGEYVKPAYVSTTPPPLKAPNGKVTFQLESLKAAGLQAQCIVDAFVDGQKINSRTIALKIESPVVDAVHPGSVVTVRILKNGIRVETKGTVRSVDRSTGQVAVEIERSRAMVYGSVLKDGVVEVKS